MKKSWLFAVLLCLVMAQVCSGAGFALYEWSARGNALGGTLIGRADDPSAIAYNPAGITQLKGTHVLGGVTAIAPDVTVKVKGEGSTSEKNNVFLVPHVYAVQQLNDRYWLGVGEFTRFGLATDFPSNWPGRYNSYYAEIKSYSIVPCLAIKLTDNLSFAFGLEGMYFDFTKKKMKDLTSLGIGEDMDSQVHGKSFNYGFNVSFHYVPVKWLKIGFIYRSQIQHRLSGRATFDRPAALVLTHSTWFRDTDVQGDITLPDSYALGITFYPFDKLSIEGDVVYTRWSCYDKLVIEYGDDLTPPLGNTQTSSKKDWKDVWRFQFGIEYKATTNLSLMASYVYDQSPIPDEHVDYLLPANNRHLFGAGIGYKANNWSVDFSYNYLMYEDRDVDGRNDGVKDGKFTDGKAHLVGLSVSYKF